MQIWINKRGGRRKRRSNADEKERGMMEKDDMESRTVKIAARALGE